jgi:hypothetical protein
MKDALATGDAFSPQKRIASTSLHFFYCCVSFFSLLDLIPDPHSGSSGPNSMQIHSDPDPQHWLRAKRVVREKGRNCTYYFNFKDD